MEIKGKFNTATVFADIVDDFAIGQITELCGQEAFAGAKIRIMPDVHAGAGCTIGTTMTVTDRLVPNLVGVDIGCGMLAVDVTGDLDWEKIDAVIRAKVPCGFDVHEERRKLPELDKLRCRDNVDINRAQKSIGTIGGGNHFIEVEKKDDGGFMLVIHTGSRNLGKQAAEHYQQLAVQECATGFADRNELVEAIKKKYASVPEMIGETIRQIDKAAMHYKARTLAFLDR
ncbi:MAG: RtcB family protein [Synergistaceae bacterium]|nr:RtcB family protein [Synergistaceae bacterium]